MSTDKARQLVTTLSSAQGALDAPLERFRHELDFCLQLLEAHPDQAPEWAMLLDAAVTLVAEGLAAGQSAPGALVSEAEQMLAPLAAAAKQYAMYLVGHAHIDMNWMWTWPETVSVCYDTFTTMDRLMDEFPQFHFSQSQVSVYKAMQDYAPEVLARIRSRIEEGRWEVLASAWVEGDKNLASGEILCRHLLYSRRWLQENLGLPYDAVKIDWPCDTFGHAWTNPSILKRGGVTRYYHHRAISGPRWNEIVEGRQARLFWWEGPDGARILAYDDSPYGYNGIVDPQMVHGLIPFARNTGVKQMLWVYGVGNHGGGPTRGYLRAALEMQQWPLWPELKLTTTEDYFNTVEAGLKPDQLPVYRGELNFVLEGCYTSESGVKFANRQSENALVETEPIALLGQRLAGLEYPRQSLNESWQRAMFIQFHDILPGSGVRETYEYAQGLFQETLAATGMIKARSLRGLAQRVDTSALASAGGADAGLGAGVGNGAGWTGLSNWGAGGAGGDPFLVFNPAPFARDEMITVKVWDRELPKAWAGTYRKETTAGFQVRDAAGLVVPGQLLSEGNFWGHYYHEVAFPATALPGLGYRAYTVEIVEQPTLEGGAYARETGRGVYPLFYMSAQLANPVVLGNEFLELTVDAQAGGITSLVDRETGAELVADGAVLGSVLRQQEAPHEATAWMLAGILETVEPFAQGSTLAFTQRGPHVAAVELKTQYNGCDYQLTISLPAGQRRIDFELDVNWLERGDKQTGVPTLRVAFPLAIEQGRARFEIPCGVIERAADGEESPALNWVDLTGSAYWEEDVVLGATLVNDCKYAHRLSESALELTLLRSSYDPDPLPEYGRHVIRYSLLPHAGDYDAATAVRAGYAFNHPCLPISTTAHAGDLPPEASHVELLTPNVMLSGLKQAEDSEAIIVRLYEIEGKETDAEVRLSSVLVAPDAPAVETDTIEVPLAESTAKMEGGVLKVQVPAWGIVTVKVGL